MQEPHLKGPWHLTGNAAQACACCRSSTLRVQAQDLMEKFLTRWSSSSTHAFHCTGNVMSVLLKPTVCHNSAYVQCCNTWRFQTSHDGMRCLCSELTPRAFTPPSSAASKGVSGNGPMVAPACRCKDRVSTDVPNAVWSISTGRLGVPAARPCPPLPAALHNASPACLPCMS